MATVLSFLITVFPFDPYLRGKHQFYTYVGDEVVFEQVMEAVYNKDPDPIYELTSQALKDKYPELKDMIKDFLDCIDGEVISYKASNDGAGITGPQEQWRTFEFRIKTTETDGFYYLLGIGYILTNGSHPEEVGLKGMSLLAVENYSDNISTNYDGFY